RRPHPADDSRRDRDHALAPATANGRLSSCRPRDNPSRQRAAFARSNRKPMSLRSILRHGATALALAAVAGSANAVDIQVGSYCYSCTLTPSFDAVIDLTIDGVTQTFDLPYAWYSSGPSDFLSFAAP